MKQYPWLHHSKHVDGAFCRPCAFFAPEKVGGITPGQFVTKPFKSWVKWCDKMEAHARLAYHMAAMTKMDEFVVQFEHPSETIDTQLNRETQEKMEENKKVIESLLRIVMLCGKQGIALHGHRDDHIMWTNDEELEGENEGNFIELVRLQAETDDVLRRHLNNAPRNA